MVESCVRGFHVYQDIWTPTTGERLSCQTEDSNAFDPYAVAIRKSANVIGHVPRRHSNLYNYRFPSSVLFTTRRFADTLQA